MENSRILDRHFLRTTGKANPRVCFVGTASGDAESMRCKFYESMASLDCRATYERGVVLGGISAGMICWFEYGITDSVPGPLTPLRCLGWLPGTACPHYDGEAERRPAFHRLLTAGRVKPGYAADDGTALHFVDDSLAEVVVGKPGASA